MANSRQIALRTRLRNHFWMTECRPIGTVTVDLAVRKMKMIDPGDAMTPAEVAEVLSDHYGFAGTADGFIIPQLIADRDTAVALAHKRAVRASLGGLGKAAAFDQGPQGVPIQSSGKPPDGDNGHDF